MPCLETISCALLADFVKANPLAIYRAAGARISHTSLGEGTIAAVHRKGESGFCVDVVFEQDQSLRTFNIDVFYREKLHNLRASADLCSDILEWKVETARSAAELADKLGREAELRKLEKIEAEKEAAERAEEARRIASVQKLRRSVENHERMMKAANKPYKGFSHANKSSGRSSWCWRKCGELYSHSSYECVACGWLICKCGACGCTKIEEL